MDRPALRNELHLEPFGIPTLVISDDPQLIAATASAYAHWSVETPVAEPRIELRFETTYASPSEEVCLDIAVEGSRLRLTGMGAEASADATTRKGHARVPEKVARDPSRLIEVIDTLLLFLLARDGRTPVHASAFMVGDLAILLAGPSGSGKSSLAHAAASRGLPVLSDDMVFVQREPNFAVWGFPRPIHLLPDDAPAADFPVRMRNGKRKVAVLLPLPQVRAERTALVLLDRQDEVRLQEMPTADAVERLMKLDPGFDLLEQDSRDAAQALAQRGAWRLTLGRDPHAAIDHLVQYFARSG